MSSLTPRTLLAALALVAGSGCFGHVAPATGTVAGFRQPILLGPVDRLGGGAPLPTTKIGEYDALAVAAHGESTTSDGTYEYQQTIDVNDQTEPYTHAINAVAGRGNQCDIRMKTVRAWSYGYLAIWKSTVDLEGDVVVVGGGK